MTQNIYMSWIWGENTSLIPASTLRYNISVPTGSY